MNGNVPIIFPPFPILDDWEPKAHLIANVTNAVNAVVTTTEDHGYLDGMTVTVFVPIVYGMRIEYVRTQVLVIDATSFFTQIDTTAELPFSAPSFPLRFTQAQVMPVSGPFRNVAPHGISV